MSLVCLSLSVVIAAALGYREKLSKRVKPQYRQQLQDHVTTYTDKQSLRSKIEATKKLIHIERFLEANFHSCNLNNTDVEAGISTLPHDSNLIASMVSLNGNETPLQIRDKLELEAEELRRIASICTDRQHILNPCGGVLELLHTEITKYLTEKDKHNLLCTSKVGSSALDLNIMIKGNREARILELSLAWKDFVTTAVSELLIYALPSILIWINSTTIPWKVPDEVVVEVEELYNNHYSVFASLHKLMKQKGNLNQYTYPKSLTMVYWKASEGKMLLYTSKAVTSALSTIAALFCFTIAKDVSLLSLDRIIFILFLPLSHFMLCNAIWSQKAERLVAFASFVQSFFLVPQIKKMAFENTPHMVSEVTNKLSLIPKACWTPWFVIETFIVRPAVFTWQEDIYLVLQEICSFIQGLIRRMNQYKKNK